jgi:hypothetical protein
MFPVYGRYEHSTPDLARAGETLSHRAAPPSTLTIISTRSLSKAHVTAHPASPRSTALGGAKPRAGRAGEGLLLNLTAGAALAHHAH